MDKEVNFLNDEYLNKYLDYLLYEKNLSKNTLASYKEDIKDLYNYNRNYLKMNDNDILKYLSTLEALSRRSMAHHITVLRSLYGFLTRETIIPVNPCDKLIMPKLEQNLPEYLTSEEIKARVNKARKIQLERYKDLEIYSNSELTPKLIDRYCKLDETSKTILRKAFDTLGLSARAHGRILKVARTIADLDGKENIEVNHISEAIQYRNLDKKYWK